MHLRNTLAPCALAIAITLLVAGVASAVDVVEFISGAKAEGTVTKIDVAGKQITFESTVAGKKFSRVYPYSKVHAVTYKGKRHVITERKATVKILPPKNTEPAEADSETPSTTPQLQVRTQKDIQNLIDAAGRTPPDWYDATPLDYPQTLDLAWPEKPPGGWNPQANVGQYIWDVINPNESRWRSGVRFMHFMLGKHQNDPKMARRCMKSLAHMYFIYFQDYARAAYWWQQSRLEMGNDAISLAECYYHLGNRKMAETWLHDPDNLKNGAKLRVRMIKVWGIMGETDKALKLANIYIRVGSDKHMALLYAADACRTGSRPAEAMKVYQQCIDTPPGAANPNGVNRIKDRARASLEALKLAELASVERVADGTYRASSQGYSGPVEVEVQVAGHKIEAVRIAQHTEKQFYSALTDVPNQIIAKQSVQGVDATSRATMTGEAIINATAKALASGAK
jgi:uncharacterized protein with FMN-binding domain